MKVLLYSAKLLVFCLIFIGFQEVRAQSISDIKIKDLVLDNDYELNKLDTINIHFNLFVKISAAENTSKIHLMFGSAKDLGNTLTTLANFVHQNGVDSVVFNNQSYLISQYTMHFPLQLSKPQVLSSSFLTVFIEDESGNFSNKLYYSFNP